MNKVQVLLYTSYLHIIGGIETFVNNYIDLMCQYYEIGISCPQMPQEMAAKLEKKVKVFRRQERVECDTLIMIRMMDPIPPYLTYNKSIRMCHATKSNPSWYIRQDCDRIVNVSKASKKSFNSTGTVIYNPLIKTDKEALILVSATRVPALDKGKNAERMLELAVKLKQAGIPFLWFNFSDAPIQNAPKGFYNIGTYQDTQPYIAKADYLVQLSDQEGFGYSVLEALVNNTAVICTPFETTKELGVKDGVNGYIVPFDLDFDVRKLLKVPQFEYRYDNAAIATKWKQILKAGRKPKQKKSDLVTVRVRSTYHDLELNRNMSKGEVLNMTPERVQQILKVGNLIEIVEG